MSRLFVTGDTRGGEALGFKKLSTKKWPIQRELTKDDYLVILGDFGLIWSDPPSPEATYWLDWLTSKSFTTLFVGNHENHDLLVKLPTTNLLGADVGHISGTTVYHLRRGRVYAVNEGQSDQIRFLAYGGAQSTDRDSRVEGVSWWKNEIPNYADMLRLVRI